MGLRVGAKRFATLCLLVAGIGLALASNGDDDEQIDECCRCLAREHNAYGEPCVTQSTSECAEMVSGGTAVPSSSFCLRDVCGEACGEVAGTVTTPAELEQCCACLVDGRDPAGVACLSVDAVTCVSQLDNGHALSSTRACFYDVCRGQCTFLQIHSSDAGVASDAGDADV